MHLRHHREKNGNHGTVHLVGGTRGHVVRHRISAHAGRAREAADCKQIHLTVEIEGDGTDKRPDRKSPDFSDLRKRKSRPVRTHRETEYVRGYRAAQYASNERPVISHIEGHGQSHHKGNELGVHAVPEELIKRQIAAEIDDAYVLKTTQHRPQRQALHHRHRADVRKYIELKARSEISRRRRRA